MSESEEFESIETNDDLDDSYYNTSSSCEKRTQKNLHHYFMYFNGLFTESSGRVAVHLENLIPNAAGTSVSLIRRF